MLSTSFSSACPSLVSVSRGSEKKGTKAENKHTYRKPPRINRCLTERPQKQTPAYTRRRYLTTKSVLWKKCFWEVFCLVRTLYKHLDSVERLCGFQGVHQAYHQAINCSRFRFQHGVGLEKQKLRFCRFSLSTFTARRYASAIFVVVVCPWVRLYVRHKLVLYRNNWTNRAGFWHGDFSPNILHCVLRKFGYLQKLGYFPVEVCSKLRISPRQVDRVANKTRRRRRRRSSLLTTPIRQSTSRNCLLQVGEL